MAAATTAGIGAAVGWSGKWELLKRFARKMQTGRVPGSGAGGDASATLADRLKALYPQGGPGRQRTRE